MFKIAIVFVFLMLHSFAFAQVAQTEKLSEIFGNETKANEFKFSKEFTVEIKQNRTMFSGFELERKDDVEFKESDDLIRMRFLDSVERVFRKGSLVSQSRYKIFGESLQDWQWFERAIVTTSFEEKEGKVRLKGIHIDVHQMETLETKEDAYDVANFPGIFGITDSKGNEYWTSQAGVTVGNKISVWANYRLLPEFRKDDLEKSQCVEKKEIPKKFISGHILIERGSITASSIKGRTWGPMNNLGAVQLIREDMIIRCSTDDKGYFGFESVPEGKYELRLTAPAFQTYIYKLTIDHSSLPVIIATRMWPS